MKKIIFAILSIITSCKSNTVYNNNSLGFEKFVKEFISESNNDNFISKIDKRELKDYEIEFDYLQDAENLTYQYTRNEDSDIFELIREYRDKESNSEYMQTFYFKYSTKLQSFVLIDYDFTIG